jgi:hypothetical protein
MGIPFALFGAVAGLFFGFWLEARRQRFEMEKRLLAVETLRQLMMTFAHYLLNAAQIVGGFATRDIKRGRRMKAFDGIWRRYETKRCG